MIFIFKRGRRINVIKGYMRNPAIISVAGEAVIKLLLSTDMDRRSNT